MVNRRPREPGRRNGRSMRLCPNCNGTGRVGPNRSPCETCWCRGVVPVWSTGETAEDDELGASESDETGDKQTATNRQWSRSVAGLM